MKTSFRVKQPYADKFLVLADQCTCVGAARPEHFKDVMANNQGAIGMLTGKGLDEDGLERKNPVICFLGDSVTAGHFESLLPKDPQEIMAYFQAMASGDSTQIRPTEITDARESYVEKFKNKLIDKYELTSPTVINAGIAGDMLPSMSNRLERDVIRYQPDLVVINGSLNWSPEIGDASVFKEILRGMVSKIKSETKADIVLLTPNGDLPNDMFAALGQPVVEPTTPERVKAIRELAAEENVCLADNYLVWEEAKKAGIPWSELLANGINHPSVEGHEVYAQVLMQLMD